jgi:hypothetical protein
MYKTLGSIPSTTKIIIKRKKISVFMAVDKREFLYTVGGHVN